MNDPFQPPALASSIRVVDAELLARAHASFERACSAQVPVIHPESIVAQTLRDSYVVGYIHARVVDVIGLTSATELFINARPQTVERVLRAAALLYRETGEADVLVAVERLLQRKTL